MRNYQVDFGDNLEILNILINPAKYQEKMKEMLALRDDVQKLVGRYNDITDIKLAQNQAADTTQEANRLIKEANQLLKDANSKATVVLEKANSKAESLEKDLKTRLALVSEREDKVKNREIAVLKREAESEKMREDLTQKLKTAGENNREAADLRIMLKKKLEQAEKLIAG